MPDILEEIRRLREQGKDISNDELILIQMIEIKRMLYLMDERLRTVEKQQTIFNEYPPLTWLLRYQTRPTIMWIVAAFILLSLWFVSDFRKPILQFFGLPIF